jgi:lantibiotic modifying enzyme
MDFKRRAGKALQDINLSLNSYITNEASPGLLGGFTGAALFYAYYYQLTGKRKHLQQVHLLLGRSLQVLAETALPLSHCNGIAGIVWCIQHLIKMGFAEAGELDDIFTEVDEILGNDMLAALNAGQHDFLHEGLGMTLYFLEREHHPQITDLIESVVDTLSKTAIHMSAGISWQDHLTGLADRPDGEISFNMGLAHGVPAIISILAIIHQKGIATERTASLIRESINWVLSTQNAPGVGIVSLYPVLVDKDHHALTGKQSRLGWCYGDLGIATMLLNAGKCLGDIGYQQKALEIFHHTLQHRNISNSHVHDACLCHGSAGIMHIYRRAWLQTADPLLLEGANNWLAHTLQMNTHADGPAGFRFYGKETYENSYGVLEGIAGIGLALTAALDADTSPAWDRCILLC